MSVLTVSFAKARDLLQLEPKSDKVAIKRAYRKKVLEHPPDQDPEGFRLVRESYELLSNPLPAAKRWLFHPMPHVPPPCIPEAQPPSEPLLFAVLRQVVASLPTEQLESHLSAVKTRKSKST